MTSLNCSVPPTPSFPTYFFFSKMAYNPVVFKDIITSSILLDREVDSNNNLKVISSFTGSSGISIGGATIGNTIQAQSIDKIYLREGVFF